jgi:hypothetical protein
MEDVSISKFRAQVVRAGSTPASPGFVISEGQNPVDPSGSGQNHLPVTIGSPANGLAVTNAQILTIDKAQIFAGTASQFVKGDGTLDSTVYGTGTVTSVALTMPSAFSVGGSPITSSGTLAVTATGTTAQYIRGDGSLATFPSVGSGTVTSVGLSSATSGVTIGSSPITTSGTITLAIATASGSQNGLLSSIDWTTFNGKQNALTNPVTGTGTSGQVAFWSSGSAITGESDFTYNSSTNLLTIGGGITLTGAQTIQTSTGNLTIATGGGNGNILLTTNGTGFITIETAGLERLKIDSIGTSIFTRSGKSITLNPNVSALNVDSEIEVTSGMNLFFKLGGSDKFRITSSGNVGIGAPIPTHKLQILGGSDSGLRITNSSGDTRILLNPSGGQHGEFNLFNNSGNSTTYLGGNGANNYLQAQGGNVGIGTASPTNPLHIQSNTLSQLNVTALSGNTNAQINLEPTGTGIALIGPANNVAFAFRTNATERMRITSGGNVEINSAGECRVYRADNARYGTIYCNNSAAIVEASTDPLRLSGPDRIEFYPGGTEKMRISSAGVVTITNLGTGTVTSTAGVLSAVSDSSLKVDDGFIDSAIEKVLSLKPRYFYWNEKSGLPTDIRQLGFYAQEVNEAIGEEAANTPRDKNIPWGITDRSIIAMLTKAIQELKQEIDTLKN